MIGQRVRSPAAPGSAANSTTTYRFERACERNDKARDASTSRASTQKENSHMQNNEIFDAAMIESAIAVVEERRVEGAREQ
jgi:hypothetical protein